MRYNTVFMFTLQTCLSNLDTGMFMFTFQACLSNLDAGMRDSLNEVVNKVLRRVATQLDDDNFDIDDTVLV